MSSLVEHIGAVYAKESAPEFEVPALYEAGQVPMNYEHINAAWLTDVLCGAVPGAEVTGVRLDVADDGSSQRRRIFIMYNEPGRVAGLPSTVFCKAAHFLESRVMLGVTGATHAETTFFGKVRHQLSLNAPKSFHSNYDRDSYRSILLLEDLAGRAILCDEDTPLTKVLALSQVALLAELHGSFYEHKDLGTPELDFITWTQWFDNLRVLGLEAGTNHGFVSAESVIPGRLFKHKDEIWQKTVASAKAHESLPHTLIHSDVHLRNWYITEGDRMGLLDWQAVCRGHWSRDFAYALSTALTIENRRAWEDDLLRHYLVKLKEFGGPDIAFEDAHRWYRQQLFGALAFWTITLTPAEGMPDMQPARASLVFIERIAAAMDDLDSMTSFD